MRNFFNTPSSFGFNTDSSCSPDLISARSNLSNISDIHGHRETHPHQERIETGHSQWDGDGDGDLSRSYQIQDIYLGLTNIKKSKTLAILCSILSEKQNYLRLYALLAIKSVRRPVEIKKHLIFTLKAVIRRIKRHNKWEAFEKMKSHMKNERVRELKILYVFIQYLINKKNDLVRTAFNGLKQFNQEKGSRMRASRSSMIYQLKMGCNILKSVLMKKIHSPFYAIKHCDGPKGRANLPFSSQQRPSSSYIFKGSLSKSIVPSASFSYGSHKMAKMATKVAEYKIQPRQFIREAYSLFTLINALVRKRYNLGFSLLHSKEQIVKEEREESDEESRDNPQIITNILKHVCWLTSRESSKHLQRQKKNQELRRKRKIKIFLLGLKRKERNELKAIFKQWRAQVFSQREQVMEKIKDLQRLKEMYIQNLK